MQGFTHRPFLDTQAFFEHALETGKSRGADYRGCVCMFIGTLGTGGGKQLQIVA